MAGNNAICAITFGADYTATSGIGLAIESRHPSVEPVKVGVIFPLSGGAGPQGQMLVKSIQTMAALINESGGVMGK